GELLRALLPELHRVLCGLALNGVALHERACLERLRRRKFAVFLQEGLNRVAWSCLGHVRTSLLSGMCRRFGASLARISNAAPACHAGAAVVSEDERRDGHHAWIVWCFVS